MLSAALLTTPEQKRKWVTPCCMYIWFFVCTRGAGSHVLRDTPGQPTTKDVFERDKKKRTIFRLFVPYTKMNAKEENARGNTARGGGDASLLRFFSKCVCQQQSQTPHHIA